MLISTEYTVLKYFEMECAHYVKGVDMARRWCWETLSAGAFIEGQGHTVLAEGRMRFVWIFCY